MCCQMRSLLESRFASFVARTEFESDSFIGAQIARKVSSLARNANSISSRYILNWFRVDLRLKVAFFAHKTASELKISISKLDSKIGSNFRYKENANAKKVVSNSKLRLQKSCFSFISCIKSELNAKRIELNWIENLIQFSANFNL